MKDIKLGQLIEGSAARDAIHIAIAPVVAGEDLRPGDHVSLNGEGEAIKRFGLTRVGIVDPFLSRLFVVKGERFWLCLYQGTITGMRHCWEHPAFQQAKEAQPSQPLSEKENSIKWLKEQASYCGVSYERMMSYIAQDDYLNMGENETYKNIDYAAFQKHVEIVTGQKNASPPFSCSC